MDNKSIVKLGLDVYRGTVQTEFTNGKDAEATLLEALIEANGGSDKIDLRARRDGRSAQMYAIVEQIINIVVEEGLQGDEFFMNHVEYINTKEGDKNEFVVESDSEFIVAEMAHGVATPRRQRIGARTSVAVPTKLKGIRVYEELRRVLAGRVSWTTFIDKVSQAVIKERYAEIYTAFSGLSESTKGLDGTYVVSGTADEEAILALVEHVEAATGMTAHIVGTKSALRKIPTAVVAEQAKNDYYNVGHYGKLAGVDMMHVKNMHKAGSTEFMLPNNKIWVIAADDKFIKHITEGDAIILDKDPMTNADMSQEYFYCESTGCAVILGGKIGMFTFAE